MLQTLLHIPLSFLFVVWGLGSVMILLILLRRQGFNQDTRSYLVLLALIGLFLAAIAPQLCDDEGLPIRGYGVMMLLGVTSGTALAARRARLIGLDPEVIYSLAFWLFLSGIVGARLFYIIQYWDEFQRPTFLETAKELINFTKGGLVVFGSAIAGGAALIIFVRKYRLPGLALADLVAPSLMLALAFGRVGCFCNGCCWGGQCDLPWAVEFPFGSPPYIREVEQGEVYVHGLKFSRTERAPAVIAEVEPGSPAEAHGLRAGDRIVRIRGNRVRKQDEAVANVHEAEQDLLSLRGPGSSIEIDLADGRAVRWDLPAPREHSLPLHPVQIYAAIDALMLCLFLLAYYPYRRRDGEVVAWMLTIHPISRILQELIRNDEAKNAFGTTMTISTNVSLLLLACGIALWFYVEGRPRGIVTHWGRYSLSGGN